MPLREAGSEPGSAASRHPTCRRHRRYQRHLHAHPLAVKPPAASPNRCKLRQERWMQPVPGLVICHFMGEANRFIFDLLHRRANRDHVPRVQLALVCDLLLNRHHPQALVFQARGRQSELCHQLPGCLVELSHVPHHIHVGHVIALWDYTRVLAYPFTHIKEVEIPALSHKTRQGRGTRV